MVVSDGGGDAGGVTRGVVTVVVVADGTVTVTVREIGPGGVVTVVDETGRIVSVTVGTVVVGTCRPSAPPASASAEPKPAATSTMPAATPTARRPPSQGARTPVLYPKRRRAKVRAGYRKQ